MPINELLAELNELPSIAHNERWKEASGANVSEMPILSNDYRLTDTPRRISERIAELPEGEFEEALGMLIEHFPTKSCNFTSCYGRRVFCTVAAHAFR